MAELAIPVRYCRLSTDPGVPCREEHLERRELAWPLKAQETALVLVDVWDVHYMESHLEDSGRITRERIVPVVEACRRVGIAVVHAPCPQCAAKYPQWVRYAGDDDLFGRPPAEPDEWPPADLRAGKGDYACYAKPVEPRLEETRKRDPERRRIVEAVAPEPEDFVVKSGAQLHRLLKHRRILHLLYAGFATNMCILYRDYGTRAMKDRGYNVILVRDCTTGIEMSETAAAQTLTNAAILEIEMVVGVTTTSEALLTACGQAR